MHSLHNYSNVNSRRILFGERDLSVSIFEAHRYSTLVHFCAYKEGLLSLDNPPMLVLIDQHEDMETPRAKDASTIDVSTISERDFLSFVNWDMAWSDGDWITTSLELGLLSDVLILGAKGILLEDGHNVYESADGKTHNIWKLGSLWDELEDGGRLNDIERPGMRALWENLGWDGERFIKGQGKQLVVDIDLDFMEVELEGVSTSIPKEVLASRWNTRAGVSSHSFFQGMLGKSNVVCIAMESDYCGSLKATWNNLSVVDELCFDGELLRFF